VRTFWGKLLKLALPLFVLMVGVELRFQQAPNSYRLKDRALRLRGADFRVLALGSSHAAQGIRPDAFPVPLFNLANVSQSLMLDERLFQRYLAMLPHLRYVIVTISDFSLDYRLNESPEAWRDNFYHRYNHVTEKMHWWNRLWRPTDASLYLLYGSTIVGRALWTRSWHRGHEEYDANGWFRARRQPPSLDIDADAQSRVDLLNACMNRCWRLENVAALYRLIASAQENHVEVVLVTLPVRESYTKRMSPGHWRSAQWVVRSLCRQSGVRYLNHFQDPSLNAAEFADSDHVNEDGAARISRTLAAEMGLFPPLQKGARHEVS
jgi:hypothetical protein